MSLLITDNLELTYLQYAAKLEAEVERRVNRCALAVIGATLPASYFLGPLGLIAPTVGVLGVNRFAPDFFRERVNQENGVEKYVKGYASALMKKGCSRDKVEDLLRSIPLGRFKGVGEWLDTALALENGADSVNLVLHCALKQIDFKALLEEGRRLDPKHPVSAASALSAGDKNALREIQALFAENPGDNPRTISHAILMLSRRTSAQRKAFREDLNAFIEAHPGFENSRRECLDYFGGKLPEFLKRVIPFKVTSLKQLEALIRTTRIGWQEEIASAAARLMEAGVPSDRYQDVISNLAKVQKSPLNEIADRMGRLARHAYSFEKIAFLIEDFDSKSAEVQEELTEWLCAFEIKHVVSFIKNFEGFSAPLRKELLAELRSLGISKGKQVEGLIETYAYMPPPGVMEDLSTFRDFIEANRDDEEMVDKIVLMRLFKFIDGEIFDYRNRDFPDASEESQVNLWIAAPAEHRQLVVEKMANLPEPEQVFKLLDDSVIEGMKRRIEMILDRPNMEEFSKDLAKLVLEQREAFKLDEEDGLFKKAKLIEGGACL